MKQEFPPELIADCQKLLLEQAGIEIDADQAEIYLEKLGRLMLEIVKIYDEKHNPKKKWMEKIIPIDNNARIVIEPENYILQYRRKSKSQISWRTAGYFSEMTSLCLEYLNASPNRPDNAIRSLEDLVDVIKQAENRICKIIINHMNYEKIN